MKDFLFISIDFTNASGRTTSGCWISMHAGIGCDFLCGGLDVIRKNKA